MKPTDPGAGQRLGLVLAAALLLLGLALGILGTRL
jgi:hypothetical protein